MQIRCHFWDCIKYCCLFHRRTRTAYVYNGCLVWYNVVSTPRICSSVKYNTVNCGKVLTSVTSATNQHTHYRPTCTRNRNDKRQEINIYPNWLYCTLEIHRINNMSYDTRHPLYRTLFTNYDYKSHILSATNNVSLLLPLPALQLKYATRM